ncbi:hypothetical protein SeLEV6574_g03030 [Synchytrium endobioticum]|nr:hypothetical protein SeLEV6574_g03030 [Synchytrium endobioticum]
MAKSKYVEEEDHDELASDGDDAVTKASTNNMEVDEDTGIDDEEVDLEDVEDSLDELDELDSDSYVQNENDDDDGEYKEKPSNKAKSRQKLSASTAPQTSKTNMVLPKSIIAADAVHSRKRSKGSPSNSSTGSARSAKSASGRSKAKGRKSRLSGRAASEDDYEEDDDDDMNDMDELDDFGSDATGTPASAEMETASKKSRKRKKGVSSDRGSTGSGSSRGAGRSTSSLKPTPIVPFEPVVIPMGGEKSPHTVDKFLGWRMNPDNLSQEQLLVKYKNMSYYHAEWLPRESVEFSKMAAVRVRRFLEKPAWETQWNDEEFFNPSFVKIDRIVDEGELNNDVYYLVKWQALTYDMCTWESETTVKEIDEDKIEEFHTSRLLTDEKQTSQTQGDYRPPAKSWQEVQKSPTYKDDHQLRPYQLEGLNWLTFCWYKRQNSILADEMGLGKTVQSVVFLHNLYENLKVKGPFLIITPLSTIGNWEREFKNWTDLNLVVYHGNEMSRNLIVETEFYFRDQRGQPIPGLYKFDVILTTYEMAMAGVVQLKPIQWRAAILDEAHRLKKSTSKISETLKTYRMDHRVLLTGTPLQNSLEELWSLLNFLEPDRFRDERAFQMEYGSLTTASDVERLQNLLKPLMLRRLKEDVEKSIPVKEETIIEVELTTMQKKWYRSILEKNFTWLKAGGKKTNTPQLINTMMELRKCCIHPFLLNGAEEQIYAEYNAHTPEAQFSCLIEACGKMVLIDKLLKKLKDGKHKVLIFSQMTKCLDIIQDYLRRKSYGFERIDGSVRGDVRQAAIDRFCSLNSDSFVFLLCTRAGGVGINLTVADTVVIFDSDWNPQNDLQAQSRCHRIGQTKPVQIYRLVTRGTYEREMFDRASIKLGLDRAVLQRMGAPGSLGQDESATQLSKMEVETLLKKGAYGAFMDDEASKAFCEEDIDQILERRTQVIKHDANEKRDAQGSIFSKASFASAETDAVDLNDPEFWDKVAAKASLNVVHQPAAPNLIIEGSRERRQTQRFGKEDMDDSTSEADVASTIRDVIASETFTPSAPAKKKTKHVEDLLRLWSGTERQRFERRLMNYGYGQWDKMHRIFPRRSIADLKACGRLLMQHCIVQPQVAESELIPMAKDIMAADCPTLEGVGPEVPYIGATQNQILEFKSFLEDTTPDHKANLGRRAKSILTRVTMLWNIKIKVNPHPGLVIPPVQSTPPAPWWGPEEDRDLLIGVIKHGYGQYDNMKEDLELVFSQKLWAKSDEEYVMIDDGEGGADREKDGEMDVDGDVGGKDASPDLPTKMDEDGKSDTNSHNGIDADAVTTEGIKHETAQGSVSSQDVDMKIAVVEANLNGVAHSDAASMDIDDQERPIPVIVDVDPATGLPFGVYRWPSSADLGVRIKRLVAAFQRAAVAEKKASQRKEKDAARDQVKKQKEIEKSRSKEKDLTKREKIAYIQYLLSYGVETIPGSNPVERDWGKFRTIANLERKSVAVLEAYYQKLLALAREVIDKFQSKGAATGVDANGNPLGSVDNEDEEEGTKKGQSITREGDTMTLYRARRIFFRLELFRQLREEVLSDEDLDNKLSLAIKHSKSGLPRWYAPEHHDRAFLKAVAKYGILRSDLVVQDQELPFGAMFAEYQRLKKENPMDIDPSSWLAEPFWMREQVANRRLEALIDLATSKDAKQTIINDYEGKRLGRRSYPRRRKPMGKGSGKSKGKSRGSYDSEEDETEEDGMDEEDQFLLGEDAEIDTPLRSSSRTPKLGTGVDLNYGLELYPKLPRPARAKAWTPTSSIGEEAGFDTFIHSTGFEYEQQAELGDSSGDDTDDMLEQAGKRTKKQKKQKAAETDDGDYRAYSRNRKPRTSTPVIDQAPLYGKAPQLPHSGNAYNQGTFQNPRTDVR